MIVVVRGRRKGKSERKKFSTTGGKMKENLYYEEEKSVSKRFISTSFAKKGREKESGTVYNIFLREQAEQNNNKVVAALYDLCSRISTVKCLLLSPLETLILYF